VDACLEGLADGPIVNQHYAEFIVDWSTELAMQVLSEVGKKLRAAIAVEESPGVLQVQSQRPARCALLVDDQSVPEFPVSPPKRVARSAIQHAHLAHQLPLMHIWLALKTVRVQDLDHAGLLPREVVVSSSPGDEPVTMPEQPRRRNACAPVFEATHITKPKGAVRGLVARYFKL